MLWPRPGTKTRKIRPQGSPENGQPFHNLETKMLRARRCDPVTPLWPYSSNLTLSLYALCHVFGFVLPKTPMARKKKLTFRFLVGPTKGVTRSTWSMIMRCNEAVRVAQIRHICIPNWSCAREDCLGDDTPPCSFSPGNFFFFFFFDASIRMLSAEQLLHNHLRIASGPVPKTPGMGSSLRYNISRAVAPAIIMNANILTQLLHLIICG